jgi:hypothetical protein
VLINHAKKKREPQKFVNQVFLDLVSDNSNSNVFAKPTATAISSHSGSNTAINVLTAAASASRTSPRSYRTHKRYSSIHRRNFAKMDSIASHYAVKKQQPVSDNGTTINISGMTSKSNVPNEEGKRVEVTSVGYNSPAKRRKMMNSSDQNIYIGLRSSTSIANLTKIVAEDTTSKTEIQIPTSSPATTTAKMRSSKSVSNLKKEFEPPREYLQQPTIHTHTTSRPAAAAAPLSPSKRVEQLLNTMPHTSTTKPKQIETMLKSLPSTKALPQLPTIHHSHVIRKSPSLRTISAPVNLSVNSASMKSSSLGATQLPKPTVLDFRKNSTSAHSNTSTRLQRSRAVAKSTPNLKSSSQRPRWR